MLRELLDERCDAFVFNILVVPPGRDAKTVGVGSHVDQTLMQPSTQREQNGLLRVRRLYLQVPPLLVVAGRRHAPREGSCVPRRPVARAPRLNLCEINRSSVFLGDDAAVLARSSGEEPARHAIEQASRRWRGGLLY